jgi:hypothetical protein
MGGMIMNSENTYNAIGASGIKLGEKADLMSQKSQTQKVEGIYK